ncbi:Proteasome activator BLM10 [Coemansia thaxteri]|uniref:Proteasome activator BLM10 n=1 Tax=Coemansia thaxteri TaxID=2663907 RepID=A0A9W8BJW7_9FUNG|nr:Proteasome activator BLM10 [Coemansia thaxteri]
MRLDEFKWNRLLPYDRGSEDAEFEQTLVTQLRLCILGSDYRAVSALLSQFDSNYNVLSLPLRIHTSRILYELATTQTLDPTLMRVSTTILTRTLGREEQLTIDDLALDWRKLYDLVRSLVFPKVWQDNPLQRRTKLKNAVDLGCIVNRFFPPSAAREIFQELLPQLQFNSMDWQIPIVQMLNLFLPTSAPPKGSSANLAEASPELWLPTIFSLWSFNLRTSGYDSCFMDIVTYLAVEQKGLLTFSKDQVRFVFASGLHFFKLPITRGGAVLSQTHPSGLSDTGLFYRLPQNGCLPMSEEKPLTFARFIAYTIHDESPGGTMELFEQLVQMIEPFYHPANNGTWTANLARFLRHLSRELMERVYVESDSECKVPVDMRLTRRVRRRFVLAVRTLAMLLLFSKTEDSISKSHSTLKYLAMVEPDLIFAPLLETLYTSIDSVTETHRMLSAMRALAKLATTLSNFSHYPEGAQHVAPLLNLTLPGIDANDTTKTWFTLVFIRNLCFNGVVFEELPTVGDMPAPRASSKASSAMDLAEDPSVDNLPEPDMDQIEWMTRASTAQFETWIDQYLRRIFALVTNLSSSLDSSEALSSGDGGLHTLVGMTTKMVLHQCSERYYPMISRLMTDFVTSIGSLSVVDPMCKIVYTFASAMPKHALQSLLPYCCERIAEDIENGVGLAPSLSRHARSHSETTLIWFTSALYALTDLQCGEHLVPYRTQILATFSLLLDRCMSGRVFRTASRALRHIIVSLTRIQPERGRSVPTSVWNDPTFRENHFRHWGQLPQIDDPGFALEWHSRSKQAIDFALELVRSLIVPRISELERFIDAAPDKRQSTSTKDHVYLNKLLGILQSGVCALGEFVPPPGTPIPDDELVDATVESSEANNVTPHYRFGGQVSAGYIFTDPSCSEYKEIVSIRDHIGQVTAKALAYMAKNSEDDVENIKTLTRLAQDYVCFHGVDRSTCFSERRGWNAGLESFTYDNNQCAFPRYFAAKRAAYLQTSRMLHNTRFMRTNDLLNDIVLKLSNFCLSPYSEIRSYAISALDNITSTVPATKYPLIPQFIAELDDNEASDPEKMIGALRVLDTMPMRQACLRNWHYFPPLVLALCRAQHEDKPAVKKLIMSTSVSQVVHVSAPQPVQLVSECVQELAHALGAAAGLDLDNSGLESAVAQSKAKCLEYFEFARAENTKLINSLVEIVRDAGTTWRFAAIAGYYLDHLSSADLPPEPSLLKALADNLTSDLLLFREGAAAKLAQLLGNIKHRSKLACSDISLNAMRSHVDLSSTNAQLFYERPYAELCERALAGGDKSDAALAPYLDNPATGWFAWPLTAKVYATPLSGGAMAYDKIEPASQLAYKAVRDTLFANGKWDRITKLFSLETNRAPEEEAFHLSHTTLFTQVFSLFDFPLLELAWPSLERLALDNERISSQRAAAELVVGVLRGSKHWSQESLEKMWKLFIPLMSTVFAKLRPDTLRFWQTGLRYAFARRDPRRFLPLVRLIIYGNPFDPQSEASFSEAVKLELLTLLINSWDWRIAPAILASKPRLHEALAHPYKMVRDAAGVLIYELSSSEFSVSYSSVQLAIEDFARYGPTGRDFSPWSGTQRTQRMIGEMTSQVSQWKAEHIPSNEGTSNYSRGSKTLLMFFLAAFNYSTKRLTIAHIPSILPLISVLQEQIDDEEVSRLAKVTMQYFSQLLYTAQMSEEVASCILALLEESSHSWHVVTKTMPLLCTLTFSNRFTLSHEVRMKIVDTTARFLEHDQIEVRHSASTSLAYLVKCASNNVIADINSRFSAKIVATRLPRVRYGKPPKNPEAYNQLVLTRHAGVLGLSCLVLAFPYTIPDWLPGVLVLLAGCIDDPSPIQSTVQRTFAEFRRTHMDTWHEDRKRFTSSQLELLTDMLVSPCYYA